MEAAQIWRELLHIIFRQIILEAAQIWREPQQKNRHNHTTVPAQIWRELAPQHFLADCFGGSSDLAGTGSHYFPVDCFGGAQLYCTLSMYVTPKTISCRNQKTNTTPQLHCTLST